MNSISVAISPIVFRIPPVKIYIHVSAPVDIRIGWVIENMIIMYISIMVIMRFYLSGWVYIMVIMSIIVWFA